MTEDQKEQYFESSDVSKIAIREKQLQENPLHFYAGFGKMTELKNSIDSTANIDLRDNNGEGHPALYYAALYNHTNAVRMLLDNHANPNIKGYYDWTPLHVAANLEIAEMLLARGADICAQTIDGRSPLTDVFREDGSKYASEDYIKFLIEKSKENACLPGYIAHLHDEA